MTNLPFWTVDFVNAFCSPIYAISKNIFTKFEPTHFQCSMEAPFEMVNLHVGVDVAEKILPALDTRWECPPFAAVIVHQFVNNGFRVVGNESSSNCIV